MRVQIVRDGERPESLQPMAMRPEDGPLPSSYAGWAPVSVIGAQSLGGLLLPAAEPTAGQLYAPRGVYLDSERTIVADTGNHRVLVFSGELPAEGAKADVVLGQPDMVTEGPQAGGRGPERGMHLPTGVIVDGGRLVVGDAWNHRILVWDRVPESSDVAPDLVLGQPDAVSVEANGGHDPDALTFYWPFGVAVVDGRFYVADTGNRRVLCWRDGVPQSADTPPDIVLGQPDMSSREENRGAEPGPDSFRWPHTVTGDGAGGVLVADAGNHRCLGWEQHPDDDVPADYVLGQPDMATAVEFPYRPQTGNGFRFPYAAASLAASPATGPGAGLVVSDTANNRILLWDEFPHRPDHMPDAVLGQPDFAGNGENRWDRVQRDSMCWPYGVGTYVGEGEDAGRRVVAVADSGNNRVVIWERR